MDRRTTLNLFIGLLMAVSLLGSFPVANGQVGVSPAHVQAVKAEAGQDPDAPFGTWTKLLDRTTFYLHRNVANDPEAPVQGALPSVPVNEGFYLDYERPKNDITNAVSSPLNGAAVVEDLRDPDSKKIVTANPGGVAGTSTVPQAAFFVLPLDLTQTVDLRVYAIDFDIYATCQSGASAPGTAGAALVGSLEQLRKNSAGQWVPFDSSTNGGHQPYGGSYTMLAGTLTTSTGAHRYTGSFPLATSPNPAFEGSADRIYLANVTEATQRLAIGLYPSSGSCTIHYDSLEMSSNVKITADSSRVNTWIENRDGEYTEGLASPSRAAPDQRRFMVQVTHASAFPKHNGYANPRIDNAADANEEFDYLDDFWNTADTATAPGPDNYVQASTTRIRLRDMHTLGYVQGTDPANILQIGREVVDLGSGINRVQYLYQYPGTLAEHPYRAEVYSEVFGVAVSQDVSIGIKGFTVDALDPLVHAVNPKNATEFRFRIRNIGGEDDTVTVVAATPGNSWTADIVGASSHFLRANRGEAEVVLRVTPPATAVAGASQAITIIASSANFPNDVPPISKVVTVNVVATPATHGVYATSRETLVVLAPGTDTSLAGVRVRNNGTTFDQITLQPIVPSSAVGWTFQATPLSREILAGSSADFAVRIRAPVDAPAGQTFTLGLLAQRLGDAATSDRVDVTITIQVKHSFTLKPLQADIPLRNFEDCPPDTTPVVGPDVTSAVFCGDPPRDTDADFSSLHRIFLNNTGPVADEYTFSGRWITSGNVQGVTITTLTGTGSSNCDGNDDRPEFWTYEFGDPAAMDNTPGKGNTPATVALGKFTVPAMSTRLLYMEMSYENANFSCSTPGSAAAAFTLTAVSRNDPGNSNTVRVGAYRTPLGDYTGPNDYTGGLHNVRIEPDVTDLDARETTQLNQKAQHTLRVTNTGNEKDTLIVQVAAGSGGWTRQLQLAGSVPSTTTCSFTSAAKTRWLCNMGAFDEVAFNLNVTPNANVALGAVDRAAVSVISGDEGSVNDFFEFTTSTVGTFQFDAVALSGTHNAERGKTALVPFTLRNLGSNADRLNVSVTLGDPAWTPRLGLPQSNFVPGGKDLGGFLAVTVPNTATTGKPFQITVTSATTGAIDLVEFTVVPVSAGTLVLAGTPSNVTTIAQTGVARYVNVTVSEPGGNAGRAVDVALVPGSLPAGWTLEPSTRSVTLGGTGTPSALASFQVTAPAGSLGSSRVPLLLRATSNPAGATGQADLLLQLADVFGVKLSPRDNLTAQTITPGGQVRYNMTVENLGTSTDTVRFGTSAAPAGWLIQTDPAEVSLGPLENRSMTLLVRAPSAAVPRMEAVTTLQAASLGSGAVSAVTVKTKVGFYELVVDSEDTGVMRLAPTETASRVYSVKNNGTVADEVLLTAILANTALAEQVSFRVDPALIVLAPNQTKEVRVDVTLGAAPPSASDIAARAVFASRFAPATAPANASLPLDMHAIRYVALDADGDGINEYAVDRDDPASGYEDYLDTGVGGGKASTVADLERFLTEDARTAATKSVVLANGTTVEVLDLVIDGDKDGLRDLFIDSTGDGLPDHYWDPDSARRQDLATLKDVDGDAVPDYFVDTDGALGLDRVYSLRQGTFTDLVTIDIDGDGTKDFIVDKNGNGKLDADETVLYSKSGRLLAVQKIDMDGNDELDSVFDTDGDGTPDYFIPAGEESAVEIVLKDVNGDGNLDWAYDADGDGRLDSYYDPATGEVGFIDAQSSFRAALKEHWYIGALFGVVLVLFVVLLIVTRR